MSQQAAAARTPGAKRAGDLDIMIGVIDAALDLVRLEAMPGNEFASVGDDLVG